MPSNTVNFDQDFTLTDKIAYLIQNNRKKIIIVLIAIFLLIAAGTAYGFIAQNKQNKSATNLLSIEEAYGDYKTSEEDGKPDLLKKIEDLYAQQAAMGTSDFSYERASYLMGSIYFDEKQYDKALDAYNAVIAGNSSYLIPLSRINKAAIYETQDKIQEAFDELEDLYSNFDDQYYDKAHVLLNLGRLQESLGDKAKALTYYKAMEEEFSSSNWTKIAINRILFLED